MAKEYAAVELHILEANPRRLTVINQPIAALLELVQSTYVLLFVYSTHKKQRKLTIVILGRTLPAVHIQIMINSD